MNNTDPTGEAGVVGAILGAAAEIAIQRATGTDWEDIDLGDVAVAAAAGATGLGAVTQAGKAYKAYKAYKATQKGTKAAESYTQNKAQEGSQRKLNNAKFREGKAKEQSKAATKDAVKTVGKAVGAVAGAKTAKEASPSVTPKDLKERDERQ